MNNCLHSVHSDIEKAGVCFFGESRTTYFFFRDLLTFKHGAIGVLFNLITQALDVENFSAVIFSHERKNMREKEKTSNT